MAVAFRLLDVAHYDDSFRASMSQFGPAPQLPERARQERDLFGFFVSGLSAIESYCYGLCAVAWEADPKKVSLATTGQKKGVSPESTRDRFNAHFARDPVTTTLARVLQAPEYAEWIAVRNALTHRTSPPRKHFIHLGSAPQPAPPSECGSMTLDLQTTSVRREWLRESIAALLADAGRFANAHFS